MPQALASCQSPGLASCQYPGLASWLDGWLCSKPWLPGWLAAWPPVLPSCLPPGSVYLAGRLAVPPTWVRELMVCVLGISLWGVLRPSFSLARCVALFNGLAKGQHHTTHTAHTLSKPLVGDRKMAISCGTNRRNHRPLQPPVPPRVRQRAARKAVTICGRRHGSLPGRSCR